MRRLFCAVEVRASKEIIAAVDILKQNLAGEYVKWVNPDNYHITLKFFGNTEERNMLEIAKALQKCTPKVLPFSFQIEGLGFFDQKNSPSVIWFGIKNKRGFVDLHREVNKSILTLGYLPEKPAFSPHLTIGRIKFTKKPIDTEYLKARISKKALATIEVDSFSLIESILNPDGPHYSVVERFQLENC